MATQTPNRTTIVPYSAKNEQACHDDRVYLVVMRGTKIGQVFTLNKKEILVGRDEMSQFQLLDADISRHHALILWDSAAEAFRLEDLESSNGTFINGEPLNGSKLLARGDKLQLGANTVLRICYGDEVEAEYARTMAQAALRDWLTGLYNRRYFDEHLQAQLSCAVRHKVNLSLILIDIDHFKRINDRYGHPCGDSILRIIAAQINLSIRREDTLARYGGEEFVIICPQTTEAGAATLAERICAAQALREFEMDGELVQVTLSCGVSALDHAQPAHPQRLIATADRALYQAKHQGRNQVVVFSLLPPPAKE